MYDPKRGMRFDGGHNRRRSGRRAARRTAEKEHSAEDSQRDRPQSRKHWFILSDQELAAADCM
jgi:hypothetical protein